MDQQLKQRLVGISVIVALAVIFLPMILDGSGQHLEKLDVQIPVPPRVESRIDIKQQVIELKREVEALPEMAAVIVDEVSDPPLKLDTESKTETTIDTPQETTVTTAVAPRQTPDTSTSAPQKPVTNEPPEVSKTPEKALVGGEQWVIQIGSFQDKDKAYAQRDKLRKSRLSAVFIEKFTQDGSLRYRVRMGPFLTRESATVVKNKVLAKYNIKGWLMKYEK